MHVSQRYELLIHKIQKKYSVFIRQGFESYIFEYSGWLLKIFKFFVLEGLSLEQQKKLYVDNRNLLKIYSPQLEAEVVASNDDIEWCSLDKCIEVSLYGLKIKMGNELFIEPWKTKKKQDKYKIVQDVGKAIALCHKQALIITSPPRYEKNQYDCWLRFLVDAYNSMFFKNSALAYMDLQLVQESNVVIDYKNNCDVHEFYLAHGDLILSNIVIYNKKLQFIDPGLALAMGSGLAKQYKIKLDYSWDIVCFAMDLQRLSSIYCVPCFLQKYLRYFTDLDKKSFFRKLRFHYLLYLLMSIVMCLKKYDDCKVYFYKLSLDVDDYLCYCYYEIMHECLLEITKERKSVYNFFRKNFMDFIIVNALKGLD